MTKRPGWLGAVICDAVPPHTPPQRVLRVVRRLRPHARVRLAASVVPCAPSTMLESKLNDTSTEDSELHSAQSLHTVGATAGSYDGQAGGFVSNNVRAKRRLFEAIQQGSVRMVECVLRETAMGATEVRTLALHCCWKACHTTDTVMWGRVDLGVWARWFAVDNNGSPRTRDRPPTARHG